MKTTLTLPINPSAPIGIGCDDWLGVSVETLAKRMATMETGYKAFEGDYEMTDAQLATMNAALGLTKTKDYRPYCLRCSGGPRVALKPDGFFCWKCGNRFGFDLQKLTPNVELCSASDASAPVICSHPNRKTK